MPLPAEPLAMAANGRDHSATAAGSRPRLGLAPLTTANNPFTAAFAGAIGDGFEKHHVAIAEEADWQAIAEGAFDVVVMHWPTFFFRPRSRRETLANVARMAKARAKGTRFVWVVHNLAPHDGGAMASRLTSALFVAQLSGIVHLSEHSRDALRKVHRVMPWTREVVTVHGLYPRTGQASDGAPDGQEDRRDTPRLLAFGHVRPYKNLPFLVARAREAGVALTVAGRVWDEGEANALREAAGDDPLIRLDLRDAPLPDAELDALIAAHDGVVLPYAKGESVLNSGVALHALSRDRPVLAPQLGALPELATHLPGWVQLFKPPLEAADLTRFASFAKDRPADARPDLRAYGWDSVGETVTGFLEGLVGRRRAAPRARESTA